VGGGRLGAARTWLLLRCGMELRTVLALGAVLVVASSLAVRHYVTGRPQAVRVPAAAPVAAEGPRPTMSKQPALTVDVAGKVAHPGLRRLPAGSRVADALAAAGGPLPGADITSLNLARRLADGEQLLVGRPAPPPGANTADGAAGPTSPVSLNSASLPQLDALPGVGPVLAQHILDFRNQHGGFATLQQLRQVPGIGDRKFATLKSLVQP
jgi:competence protein ComEA